MKASKLLRHLLPISALFISSPFIATALRAQEVESAVADVKSASAKAQLKALDHEIDQLDMMADNAPTAEDKAAAKARIAALKDRRSELRKSYVQAKYDGLKADIKTEYNKASAWTKKTFSSDSDAKMQRKLDKASDKAADVAHDTATAVKELTADAGAAVTPAAVATSADIAAYKADPSKENKADVKASLATLDNEIKALDDRADALPKGEERDAVKLRVKALKDRRGELASDFRKARYDALKADVKAEWNKLIHKN